MIIGLYNQLQFKMLSGDSWWVEVDTKPCHNESVMFEELQLQFSVIFKGTGLFHIEDLYH